MIGEGKMQIEEITIERITGKELRNLTATAKDKEEYLVWIQKVDRNVQHTLGTFITAHFKKRG